MRPFRTANEFSHLIPENSSGGQRSYNRAQNGSPSVTRYTASGNKHTVLTRQAFLGRAQIGHFLIFEDFANGLCPFESIPGNGAGVQEQDRYAPRRLPKMTIAWVR